LVVGPAVELLCCSTSGSRKFQYTPSIERTERRGGTGVSVIAAVVIEANKIILRKKGSAAGE
jgi:hypothetical protein